MTLSPNERSHLQSKKFAAFLVSELTWKIIVAITVIVNGEGMTPSGWWVVMCTVIVAGFVEIGYIGGQAWLDKYVRIAEIASRSQTQDEPK
jgi:Na+/melibiose symporter-like transporter